jgi:hypothetical protein
MKSLIFNELRTILVNKKQVPETGLEPAANVYGSRAGGPTDRFGKELGKEFPLSDSHFVS